MGNHPQVVSIVTVVDGSAQLPVERVRALHAASSSVGSALELVLILNGCGPEVVDSARALCSSLSDLQIYTLRRRVDLENAVFAGLESAVGDLVITLDLAQDPPGLVPQLLEHALEGAQEVVLAIPEHNTHSRSMTDAVLSATFHRVFRTLHGYSLLEESPTARLITRGVLNDILRHDSPLVALQTLTARGGYRKNTIPAPPRAADTLSLAERVRSRWRTLIGVNAMPLRLANLLCGIGASVAVLYSVYVVAVYALKRDVMPGWTTVSLLLSAMFFLTSLVLWLISEYLILSLDLGARRPRYETAEEFASNVQTRRSFLNVEAEL